MYIRKVHIKNIRGIEDFVMEFPEGEEAGWHVLIGDNGAGKTTILKGFAAGVFGLLTTNDKLEYIIPNLKSWISKNSVNATIELQAQLFNATAFNRKKNKKESTNPLFRGSVKLNLDGENTISNEFILDKESSEDYGFTFYSKENTFFSGFGSARRFTGRDQVVEKYNSDKIGILSIRTLLDDEATLADTYSWLKNVVLGKFEGKSENEIIYDGIRHFINKGNLFPEGYSFEKVTSDGAFFKTPNGSSIHLFELSEGVKSTFALASEMLRLMILNFGAEDVFTNFLDEDDTNDFIPLYGVVLIDEIDAHLHPTWQTRIGQWFTKNFPNIQFIVSTHSPLICRGCVDEEGEINGSIWRLRAPGSEEKSGKVDDVTRDRLIYGNVLDAYGTEAFGEDVAYSQRSLELLKEYAGLDKLSTFGKLNKAQSKRRLELQKIFTTDVITEF